ncbi:roadblock/LC7 domain-containing protein [Streptomyces sp. TLI_171]|uniref:roadblock/LC7 domain-containing protein n=1 Tax=Streptomyces sp. TLI_171 TaxID=1938859 RepID=UPI000C191AEA|nr:roadblock/LC7 domain-containing protein [Streptomyces sp. TLI_171]RKE22047.1 hypothetical protein BX266_5458 [Streptomyces sp. TLI_171]
MNAPATALSVEAQNFNWLLDHFAAETAGVRQAVAVSSDGLLVAASDGHTGRGRPRTAVDPGAADRLAAVLSGLIALAGGASADHGLGPLEKVVVDLADGYLVLMSVSAGCTLGVVAAKPAALGTVAYEMALFVNRTGSVLTPTLIDELKSAVHR